MSTAEAYRITDKFATYYQAAQEGFGEIYETAKDLTDLHKLELREDQ